MSSLITEKQALEKGFPPLFLKTLKSVAKDKDIILALNPGEYASELTEEGHDQMSFPPIMRPLFCDWGPMRGLYCHLPPLNTKGAEGVKYNTAALTTHVAIYQQFRIKESEYTEQNNLKGKSGTLLVKQLIANGLLQIRGFLNNHANLPEDTWNPKLSPFIPIEVSGATVKSTFLGIEEGKVNNQPASSGICFVERSEQQKYAYGLACSQGKDTLMEFILVGDFSKPLQELKDNDYYGLYHGRTWQLIYHKGEARWKQMINLRENDMYFPYTHQITNLDALNSLHPELDDEVEYPAPSRWDAWIYPPGNQLNELVLHKLMGTNKKTAGSEGLVPEAKLLDSGQVARIAAASAEMSRFFPLLGVKNVYPAYKAVGVAAEPTFDHRNNHCNYFKNAVTGGQNLFGVWPDQGTDLRELMRPYEIRDVHKERIPNPQKRFYIKLIETGMEPVIIEFPPGPIDKPYRDLIKGNASQKTLKIAKEVNELISERIAASHIAAMPAADIAGLRGADFHDLPFCLFDDRGSIHYIKGLGDKAGALDFLKLIDQYRKSHQVVLSIRWFIHLVAHATGDNSNDYDLAFKNAFAFFPGPLIAEYKGWHKDLDSTKKGSVTVEGIIENVCLDLAVTGIQFEKVL